jgi:hypothetical protein
MPGGKVNDDEDIKAGREALDLAARLTSWAMLLNARNQQQRPRGDVVPFPRQAITQRDIMTAHPTTESTDE